MPRPNFLIIVADDLGYSDISPYGSEINTPALDFLAATGTVLTNFHTASACSPTRSMLFSGTDNHIAGLGQMAEHMRDSSRYENRPGYEGYLNFRVAALSEVLQDGGYFTTMAGKWHLGLTKPTSPHARGFHKSLAFLPGCGNHFNYEPQLEHTGDGILAPMKPAHEFWMRDDAFIDRTTDLPDNFYSTTAFTDALIENLSSRGEDDARPFFAYLPFTAPHWPLQAPREVVDKYRGVYDAGPGALRRARLRELVRLGRVDANVLETKEEDDLQTSWNSLTASERASSSRKMEIFAAMVDLIDANIQRVLDHLASTNELDNTFILFMSDNGAEGAMLEALPIMGPSGSLASIIDKYYDNSLENMGDKDSFVWYGPDWATAAMAPSRGFKTWITEGGIRCPCLVRYPGLFSGSGNGDEDGDGDSSTERRGEGGRREGGKQTNSFVTVMDIYPTILDLAGLKPPGPSFRGRDVVPVRGSSWIPHLTSQTGSFHPEKENDESSNGYITGWELFGLRAIRQGSWKALYMPPPRGKDRWELYNLDQDPGELDDCGEKEPEILQRLIEHWEVYYAETGMFDPGQEFPYTKC